MPQLLLTKILPEQTPDRGSVAVTEVADQLTTGIVVLPILTVPVTEPKFVPAITTFEPGVPDTGVMLAIEGLPTMVIFEVFTEPITLGALPTTLIR